MFSKTYCCQLLNHQKGLRISSGSGFTLLELVIVSLMLSILALITLPNFLGYVGRAREAEGKKIASSIGLAQQAFFFEKQTFASSLDQLGSDVSINPKYYDAEPVPFVLLDSGLTVLSEIRGIDAVNNNIRNYALGIYYNYGVYTINICESLSPSVVTQAPNTSTGSCVNGNIIN